MTSFKLTNLKSFELNDTIERLVASVGRSVVSMKLVQLRDLACISLLLESRGKKIQHKSVIYLEIKSRVHDQSLSPMKRCLKEIILSSYHVCYNGDAWSLRYVNQSGGKSFVIFFFFVTNLVCGIKSYDYGCPFSYLMQNAPFIGYHYTINWSFLCRPILF